jgi:hypothetical protein
MAARRPAEGRAARSPPSIIQGVKGGSRAEWTMSAFATFGPGGASWPCLCELLKDSLLSNVLRTVKLVQVVVKLPPIQGPPYCCASWLSGLGPSRGPSGTMAAGK